MSFFCGFEATIAMRKRWRRSQEIPKMMEGDRWDEEAKLGHSGHD
jgi:hypothetical protein